MEYIRMSCPECKTYWESENDLPTDLFMKRSEDFPTEREAQTYAKLFMNWSSFNPWRQLINCSIFPDKRGRLEKILCEHCSYTYRSN